MASQKHPPEYVIAGKSDSDIVGVTLESETKTHDGTWNAMH